jgi:hypothetical protein
MTATSATTSSLLIETGLAQRIGKRLFSVTKPVEQQAIMLGDRVVNADHPYAEADDKKHGDPVVSGAGGQQKIQQRPGEQDDSCDELRLLAVTTHFDEVNLARLLIFFQRSRKEEKYETVPDVHVCRLD